MTGVEDDVDDVEQVCLYTSAVDVPCLVLCSATIAVRDQEWDHLAIEAAEAYSFLPVSTRGSLPW